MKAAGALPTEERVQKMNDLQWLWYYRNIVKDEEEENKTWQERLDYVGWWINPKMAEGVMNLKKGKQVNNENSTEEQINNAPTGQSTITVEGNVVVNDSFEEELKRAMEASGEEITVLPESGSAGNAMESKDDFLSRAMGMFNNIPMENSDQPMVNENPQEKISDLPPGIDPNDIDYFEFPDEE